MNRKIYIASGLNNYKRVLAMRDRLLEYDLSLTYDWAEVWKNREEEKVSKGIVPKEDFQFIAQKEYQAVLDCDFFLMLVPGGRGTHFELGVAYSNKKPIIILSDEAFEPIAFYTLPDIKRFYCEDKAVEYMVSYLKSQK